MSAYVKPSAEDKQAKRADLLKQLGEQAETLKSSDGWQAWLETATKFHSYSVNNQLMILSQRPQATQVAGFKTWQSLGRQVKKGSKGIAIFAPMVVHEKDANGNKTDETFLTFRIVYVFDVADTQGNPLPERVWPVLDQEGTDSLRFILSGVINAQGYELSFTSESANGARGWYEPVRKAITIVDTLPHASQCKTMIHELAHALDPRCLPDSTTPRAERELVAESVAYIVSKRLGLNADESSTHYVTSWGADTKKLSSLAESVLSIVDQIEAALAPNAVTDVEKAVREGRISVRRADQISRKAVTV